MSTDFAGHPLIAIEPDRLLLPQLSVGMALDFDAEGLPDPHPLAAKRVDIAVTWRGRTVEMGWEEFFNRLGLPQ